MRPGTYDIRVNRYENKIKLRKIDNLDEILKYEPKNIDISKKEIIKIKLFLKQNKIKFDIDSY